MVKKNITWPSQEAKGRTTPKSPASDKHNNDFVLVTVASSFDTHCVVLCVGSSSHPGWCLCSHVVRGLSKLHSTALLCSAAINHSLDSCAVPHCWLLPLGYKNRHRISDKFNMPQYKLCVCDFIVIFVGDKYQLYLFAMVVGRRRRRRWKNLLILSNSLSWRHDVCMFQHYVFSVPAKVQLQQVGRDDSRLPEYRAQRVNYGPKKQTLVGRRTKWCRSSLTTLSMDRFWTIQRSWPQHQLPRSIVEWV